MSQTSDPRLAVWARLALIVGVIGLSVTALGFVLPNGTPHVFRAWLVAFNVFTGAAVGPLVILMLQYLTGGNWGFVLRPTLEAATRTLPLMALLFVPIGLGTDYVYEWARFERVHANPELAKIEGSIYEDVDPHDHELEHKMPMLNVRFFYIRAAIYFAIWITLASLLGRWSAKMDERRDANLLETCASLSAPGIGLYVISVTFASIDWGMSLEPRWYSTIYGAMFGMGQVLTGFAICVATYLMLADRDDLAKASEGQTMSDMGTLLGAFVMIWAYLSLMQFLIIWMGQIPEELPWFAARMMTSPWRSVAILLIVFGFAIPFAFLMTIDVKRNRRRLLGVTVLVIVMRAVDVTWLIAPAFDAHGPVFALAPLLYTGALAGVGGLWFATFFWQLGRRPLLPTFSPEEAAHGEAAHA